MRISDLFGMLDKEMVAARAKIHLASWNGKEHPLNVYLAGNFDEWQTGQTKRNFERPFVIALISYQTANRWLFAGAYNSSGCEWRENQNLYRYKLDKRQGFSFLEGRLVVHFERPGRNSYLYAEKCLDQMLLHQVLPERLRIAGFPGFRAIDLVKADLDLIIEQGVESWRTALMNVAGVYLISDTVTGKLYVGSATGEGGIWQRWVQYSETGHGGNVELVRLLSESDANRATAFRFSVLEIADVHESHDDILRRESHWKKILLTRGHGLNAN